MPPLELLRSYRELNTPLPFLLWGVLEHTLHQGVWLARFGNLLLSAAVIWLIVRPGEPGALTRRLLAGAGVFLCPYYLAASTHAYTDILAIFFMLLGIHWHLTKRYVLGGFAFVLAIAARQYMVAFPAALVVWELFERSNGRSHRGRAWLIPACAAGSLLGWHLFFGNFAPQEEIASYRPPIGGAWTVNPGNGLYLLACVGVYFMLPRTALFRAKPAFNDLLSFGNALIFAALLLLFIPFAPVDNPQHVVPTMGYFDRALRFAGLGDVARVAVFFTCALVAVVGLEHRPLALTLLLANAAVMMKAHTAWDKYALPLIVVLWYLEAREGGLVIPGIHRPTASAGGFAGRSGLALVLRASTPESTVSPLREIALKYIWSPMISAARNARSVSNPRAVSPVPRSMFPGRSVPPEPTTK